MYIYIYVYSVYTYGRTMVEIHGFLQLKYEIRAWIFCLHRLCIRVRHHLGGGIRIDTCGLEHQKRSGFLPWKFTMNN